MFLRIKKTWVFAIVISLAAHVLIIISIPNAAQKTQPLPVMTVRLVSVKKALPAPSSKAEKPLAAAEKASPKDTAPKSVRKSENKIKKAASAPLKNLSAAPAEAPKKASSAVSGTDESPAADTAGEAMSATPTEKESGSASGTGDLGGGEIIDGELLKVTQKTLPDYPLFSRKRKEEGTVVLIITIDKNRVVKTEIEQSSGYERLDLSATRAVKAWRFDHEGRIRARIPFSFKLK